MNISTKTPQWLALISILMALIGVWLSGMSLGRSLAYTEKDKEFAKVLENLRESHKGVVEIRNKQVRSLQEALSARDAEIGLQADLILKLKDKPSAVRYLTRVETVLLPAQPEIISVPATELPTRHLFSLTVPDGEMVVARMEKVEDKLELQTYEQKWVLNAALGDVSSTFLLRGETSFEPGVLHEIPVEVQVTHIDKDAPHQEVLEVGVALGATGVLPLDKSGLRLGGSLAMPWLHPHPAVDLLTPRITALSGPQDHSEVRAGIDAAAFNLGAPIPMIEDLWLGAGPSINVGQSVSVDLSLTTRL